MKEDKQRAEGARRHIPNLVTLARALLAVPYFVVLAFPGSPRAMKAAVALFIVSMAGDVLDGWLARRWNAESVLGRVMDPFIDKVVICGSLVYCINVPPGFVAPWMVVLILVREMGITSLRGYVESLGHNFKASVWGKLKTFTQCVAIVSVLVVGAMQREPAAWELVFARAAVWAMVAVVAVSGLTYLFRGLQMARAGRADSPPREP